MEGAAVLSQLVGRIQELWEMYGSYYALDHLDPRCYRLDFEKGLIEDDCCGVLLGGKSQLLKTAETDESAPCKRHRIEKGGEKAIVSASPETMEQKIWKELPEELLEAVIARLPIATFFRFRSVCKKWNSLLTSTSFAKSYSEVPRSYPWLITVTYNMESRGAMYDPSLRKWHYPSIPFLPISYVICPVASAGGLICFADMRQKCFYICNPLTGSFRKLPPGPVPVQPQLAVGMTLNGTTSTGGYKVLCVAYNRDYGVFDSLNNSWTWLGAVPPSIKLPIAMSFMSQAISIGGAIYFMRAEADGILSYHVNNGSWKQFIIPLPQNLKDHALAEFEGRLMLVGLLSKKAATCVCLWELQKMTLLWKEVDRMPNVWCLQLFGKHVRMACLGNRGILFLSLKLWWTDRLGTFNISSLVTYDMSSKEWQKVPDCSQWVACGTEFYPCPSALV
ncbi:F-box only protein 6 [Ananas comosus]|uniref:F-box only protein 6 n=1 Tax=Ananas comosus TaxID=4615 RepID=A0A199VF50_ANACO|nr:F-box only protein 6 [Ananas comosus]OAY75648.1 F-box only protein 6 [Ananas comosus]